MTPIIIYLFAAASAVFLVIGVLGVSKDSAKRISLPVEEGHSENKGMLAGVSNIIPFTKTILEKLKMEEKIKIKLDAAHLKLTPQGYFNLKLLLMGILVVLVYFASQQI